MLESLRNKVRRIAIPAVVDPSRSRLFVPKCIATQLGLPVTRHDVACRAHIQFVGRGSMFDMTVIPDRREVILGRLFLDSLDLLVDCVGQKLVPRDPDRIFAEIE